jgi:hypothetical protein
MDMHLGDRNNASDRQWRTEDGPEFSWGEMMSLLNSSPCIFANSMSDTIDDTEEVNNATYPVHYYS